MQKTQYKTKQNQPGYRPAFYRKDVRKRIKKNLCFLRMILRTKSERSLSHSMIKELFNDSYKYYSRILLLKSHNSYSVYEGRTKEYKLNMDGVRYIKYMMENPYSPITWRQWQNSSMDISKNKSKNDTEIHKVVRKSRNSNPFGKDDHEVMEFMDEAYGKQAISGDFQYYHKNNREWNTLQLCKRTFKKPFLAKYNYNHMYDIQTCAPTLLYQYAKECGLNTPLIAIENYLANKQVIRMDLADAIESPISDIKKVINALFCGARLIRNKKFSKIYNMFNDRPDDQDAIVEVLKQDEFIKQLMEDIKVMWNAIAPYEFTPRYCTCVRKNTGVVYQRKCQVTSKEKWNVYFRLEHSVGKCIKDYLGGHTLKYFYEHDGFSSDMEIDTEELSSYVMENSGYQLKFDYEWIGKEQEGSSTDVELYRQNHSVVSLLHNSSSHDAIAVSSFSLEDNNKDISNTYLSNITIPYVVDVVESIDIHGLESVTQNVTHKIPMTPLERKRKERSIKNNGKEKKIPMTPAERKRKEREKKKLLDNGLKL